jgi:hypothetical protein
MKSRFEYCILFGLKWWQFPSKVKTEKVKNIKMKPIYFKDQVAIKEVVFKTQHKANEYRKETND